ncbi:MAG: hypothetical protein WC755_08390 [Candidatus Woesearchaeota archaeon]|jgi:hypothetical protein
MSSIDLQIDSSRVEPYLVANFVASKNLKLLNAAGGFVGEDRQLKKSLADQSIKTIKTIRLEQIRSVVRDLIEKLISASPNLVRERDLKKILKKYGRHDKELRYFLNLIVSGLGGRIGSQFMAVDLNFDTMHSYSVMVVKNGVQPLNTGFVVPVQRNNVRLFIPSVSDVLISDLLLTPFEDDSALAANDDICRDIIGTYRELEERERVLMAVLVRASMQGLMLSSDHLNLILQSFSIVNRNRLMLSSLLQSILSRIKKGGGMGIDNVLALMSATTGGMPIDMKGTNTLINHYLVSSIESNKISEASVKKERTIELAAGTYVLDTTKVDCHGRIKDIDSPGFPYRHYHPAIHSCEFRHLGGALTLTESGQVKLKYTDPFQPSFQEGEMYVWSEHLKMKN